MKNKGERVIELRDKITSQGNKANLTSEESLVWALRAYYCQEAARRRAEANNEDETNIAETMVDIISLSPDYISALEKIANYIQRTTS